MRDICIIGVGKLGGALAIAFAKAGYRVSDLIVRDGRLAKKIKRAFSPETRISRLESLDKLSSKLVVITTADPDIEAVAASIAPLTGPGHFVFHTSGSLSAKILSQISFTGASTGSIHPLTSISDPFTGALQFRNTYFCVEGDKDAVKCGKKLVRSLGGRSFSIDGDEKALYHAAAVTAAGHVTALFDVAVKMMTASGPTRTTSKKILLPLIQSAVSNLEGREASDALTGTFARLDIQAFHRHVASFKKLPTEYVRLYFELGERSLDLIEERDGLSEPLAEFRKAVFLAKRKFK